MLKTSAVIRTTFVFFTICGSLFFLTYVFLAGTNSRLPSDALIISGLILSLGSALSSLGMEEDISIRVRIASLWLLSLTLLMAYAIRHPVLTGADNLVEYKVIRDMLELGRWPFEKVTVYYPRLVSFSHIDPYTIYYSSFALSSFGFFSEVTAIPLLTVFQFLPAIIGSLIPVLLFLVVREVFDNGRVAFVSSLLLAQSHFFFFFSYIVVKMQIAVIALLLFIFITFKDRNFRSLKSIALGFIFIFGILMSHYTIAYFAIILLSISALSPRLFGSLPRKSIIRLKLRVKFSKFCSSSTFAVFITIALFAWFMFNFPWVIGEHARVGVQALQLIIGGNVAMTYDPSVYRAKGIVQVWYYVTLLLLGISVLFVWLKEEKNDPNKVIWISGGTGLGLAFALWAFAPLLSRRLELERVYYICTIILFSFLAKMLVRTDRKLFKGRLRGLLLFSFLFLNLIMNLQIPVHDNLLLYHNSSDLNLNVAIVQLENTQSGLSLATWALQHVSVNEPISVDWRGYKTLFFTNNILRRTWTPNFKESKFLALPHYYTKNSLWTGYREVINMTSTSAIRYYSTFVNVVYNNDAHMLVVNQTYS